MHSTVIHYPYIGTRFFKAASLSAISFVITVSFCLISFPEPIKIISENEDEFLSNDTIIGDARDYFLRKASLNTKYLNSVIAEQVNVKIKTKPEPMKIVFMPPVQESLIDEFDPDHINQAIDPHKGYLTNVIAGVINDQANAQRLAKIIVEESNLAGVDPLLVSSIVFSESTYRTSARSKSGAVGLMQLLPGTAKYIAAKTKHPWHGEASLKNPLINIRLGIAYLQYLTKVFEGNMRNTLVAYNWGPGNVIDALKGKNRIPGECLQYSNKIGKHYKTLKKEMTIQMAKNA